MANSLEAAEGRPYGRPIFIVGCPRSGTTVLRSVLDAHPRICCPEWETGVLVALSKMLNRDKEWHAANDALIGSLRGRLLPWARRTVELLMHELVGVIGKQRWAEKTPGHVFHIKLIHEVFPEAQIIHIIRNGSDVVRSLQDMSWAPGRIRWSARRWVDSVRIGQEMGHKLPHGCYMEVRYEELVKSAEKTVSDICTFLEEEFAPQMLSFELPEHNSWSKRGEPLRSDVGSRHRRLGMVERLVFGRIAGSLMQELGYSC